MNEYDEYLVGYQRAAVATEAIAATLNAGQAVVLASGLTAVLVAAATATAPGTFTAGDLVSFPDIPALMLWQVPGKPHDCMRPGEFFVL